MARRLLVPITFEGGLDSLTDVVNVPIGRASMLKNWSPQADGSLRIRTGWRQSTLTGTEPTRGTSGFWNPMPPEGWYVWKPSDGLYKLGSSGANPSSGTWSKIDATVVATSGHVPFTVGAGFLVYGSRDFPSDRLRKWDGAVSSECGTFAVAGKALAFHKERFWSGGTDANPNRLYFSSIGDPNTWDLTNGYLQVGQGPTIEALSPFLDGLVIGTANEVWYLVGDGPATFSLVKLDGGSAAEGPTVLSTPLGAVVCGADIWVWPGGGALQSIGDPVKVAYYTGSWQTTAWYEGRLYVCARDPNGGLLDGGNLWSWHPRIGWAAEDTGDGNESITAIFAAGNGVTLAGLANNPATNTAVMYRPSLDTPAVFARDALNAERFQAKTGEVPLGDGVAPATMRQLHLILRQRNGDAADAALSVTPIIDGVAQAAQTISPRSSSGVFRERLDFGYTGFRLQLYFDHNVPVADAAVFDILRCVAECAVEPPR